ncbi:YezD family protein [Sneathiella sp.]|jgi:hypothetical protein|uniref:YezD family protein n=1 Tax=Sneathiella sp. TaxID=1964365 RepID=UPI002FE273CB
MTSEPAKADRSTAVSGSVNRVYTLNEAETAVLQAIREMRFGSLEVTMHDGRIVQIEKKEKMRFNGDARIG